MPRVARLYRYPIKGLSPQSIDVAVLRPGAGFPFDRMFALARPDGLYSETAFVPLPKRQYFMLMKDERLAGLSTYLDVDTLIFTVHVREHLVLTTDLATDAGIQALRSFYARVLDLPEGQLPAFAHQSGYNFSDSAKESPRLMNSLSIINLASVRDLELRIGRPVDPLRFRANVYLDGLEPWVERNWIDQQFWLGDVPMRGVEETSRCAATEVDPQTASRDIPLPRLLVEHYGHDLIGIFAEPTAEGQLNVGDSVRGAPLGSAAVRGAPGTRFPGAPDGGLR